MPKYTHLQRVAKHPAALQMARVTLCGRRVGLLSCVGTAYTQGAAPTCAQCAAKARETRATMEAK